MKLIFGLGNPGEKYENTLHNMGFMAADHMAAQLQNSNWKKQGNSLLLSTHYANKRLYIIKPQTFMNLSGDSVVGLMHYYKADLDDLVVLYDDIDLPAGKLRIRPHGSGGTHNGMRDIIKKLGTDDFARIRIGIGRPPLQWDLVDYVLSKPDGEKEQLLKDATKRAAEAALSIVADGLDHAQQYYNGYGTLEEENEKK